MPNRLSRPEAGLARGLVDYRVVRVNETSTGLRFTPRASRERGRAEASASGR